MTASHIITIELDQRKNKKYRDPDTILDYIESLIEDDEQYYIMLNEVQMLQEFEKVLNSLLHIRNADIYVTGSNSKFLSKDVITEFRGKGDENHIYPLTFKEFMEAYDGDMYRGWAEYVEHLEDAFIINKANHYNVKGRKYIGTPLKYYFEDVGLRNVRLGFRQVEETHLMENIIYNELRSRGYTVDVGVVEKRGTDENGKEYQKQLEIDFVANLGSKRYYIQSAFSMPTEEKRIQEKASLVNVNDSFKKIIVVKDVVNVTRDEDGITTMSIYDFLLRENSLEL